MRNLTIALATIVGSFALAGSAFADTSAYNKYTTTNTYGGYSETNVDAQIDSHEVVTTNSTTTKVESIADGGTTNIANVGYYNGQFSANAHSNNNVAIDPVATIYVSTVNQNSVKSVDESATIDTFNKYSFSGTSFEHEVGNRF